MTRFIGVVVALALASGCAGSKKDEAKSVSSPGPNTADTAQGGGNATATPDKPPPPPDKGNESMAKPGGGGGDLHQQPTDTAVHPPTGGGPDTQKPLDPSANANPNDPKQQARANGLLGASTGFDDSPVDLQFDTPDDPIKAVFAGAKAALGACHKTGGGTLDITLVVDATGKITGVKLAATSTLKDAKARACVVAQIKKLKLDKGTKPTAPIKLTFPK